MRTIWSRNPGNEHSTITSRVWRFRGTRCARCRPSGRSASVIAFCACSWAGRCRRAGCRRAAGSGRRAWRAGGEEGGQGDRRENDRTSNAIHAGSYGPSLSPVLIDHGSVTTANGYALLDCGDGRRLEQFGARVVDRPAPTATATPGAPDDAWRRADLRYDRDGGWTGSDLSPWPISIDGLTLELRPTPAGHVGLFPEHHPFWPWLRDGLVGHEAPAVLNLFASTGATTLGLARGGFPVTHVDGSRPAVAWGRRNAELSGLADRPIRWIVDDALAFTSREARRRRRYAAVILDPP